MDLCNGLLCFYLLAQWNFFKRVSPTNGAASGFNDGSKNGRCACPDIVGTTQLQLEEQARLLELLLGVTQTAETAYSIH